VYILYTSGGASFLWLDKLRDGQDICQSGTFLELHLQSKFGSFHIGARYVLLTLNVCGTQTGSKGNAKPKM